MVAGVYYWGSPCGGDGGLLQRRATLRGVRRVPLLRPGGGMRALMSRESTALPKVQALAPRCGGRIRAAAAMPGRAFDGCTGSLDGS